MNILSVTKFRPGHVTITLADSILMMATSLGTVDWYEPDFLTSTHWSVNRIITGLTNIRDGDMGEIQDRPLQGSHLMIPHVALSLGGPTLNGFIATLENPFMANEGQA
ncbi:hypothetical protein [Novosphingobium mathurense]|nr:hypothetical protein [Novosphingobium mathurense]